MKAGDSLGQYVLLRQIGHGGNGEVWLAKESSGATHALKCLTKIKMTAYSRFKSEVRVMRECGVSGVVPVLASCLPPNPETERPWYAMPVGKPLWQHLRHADIRSIVQMFALVAETLAQLHARGIAHRDLKPQNLIEIEDQPCIGDFGLVVYPGKDDLTGKGETLGPKWSMAPEVRRAGQDVDPLPADVYALAKTIWMFLARDERGFDGQYSNAATVGIETFHPGVYLTPLENLLSSATANHPSKRPSMRELVDKLNEWLRVSQIYEERNQLEWREVEALLFPYSKPDRATWTKLDDIVRVLDLLGSRSDLNHLFFPSGGGLDLEGAARSTREDNCIELDTGGNPTVLRPDRLLFESFGDDPEWDYFRLEAAMLEPSGVYDSDTLDYEPVTEIPDGEYAPIDAWEAGEHNGKPLPEGSRPLVRYLRGSFVIFRKTSIYNQVPETYDGRHNEMSADDFRDYIARSAVHASRSRDLTQADADK
jgi:serine/threonine-protein kinase